MITFLQNYWRDNGFMILVLCSVIFLVLIGVVNILSNKEGSISQSYTYYPGMNNNNKILESIMDIDKGMRNERGGGGGSGRGGDSKGERECRRVLEVIFQRPFDKARPYFLNNPVTGGTNNLELDCFNQELRLAVEYSGQQHYKFIPYFHKNKEAFQTQKYRDYMKATMCKENNINLIVVPYTVKIKDIQSFLMKELQILGYL